MSKQCDFLRKLADLVEQYDVVISYFGDGTHLSVAGDEVYIGPLDEPDRLRAEADFRDGGKIDYCNHYPMPGDYSIPVCRYCNKKIEQHPDRPIYRVKRD